MTLPRIDAHQHFWDPARGDYGWLTADLPDLYRKFLPEDLEPLMQSAGFSKSVVVQAAPTVAESEFLLGLADADESIAGVVGWAPLDQAAGAARVRELAAHAKLLGLRPMIQDLNDVEWMLGSELTPAIDAMIECELAFDALVKPQHLKPLLQFVDRWPSLKVVIDHAAKPVIPAQGSAWTGSESWRQDMKSLAQRPQVCCKVSGLVTESEAGSGYQVDELRPVLDHLLDAFSPHRLMFGSDWPVLCLASTYERWHEEAVALTESLTSTERSLIFGGTAASFYRLDLSS